jgi:hypothetical protein
LLLVVKSLKDDVRILWPYTGAFEGLKSELLGHREAPDFPKQQEEVSFLKRDKALGAVEVTRKLVGIRSRERFKANNVKWLQSMI